MLINQKNIILFLFILQKFAILAKHSLILQYKTYQPKILNNFTNEQIFGTIEKFIFYSIFEIGYPSKKIPIFYNFYNSSLSLHSQSNILISSDSNYNPMNSQSFKILNGKIEEELIINTENGNKQKNFLFLDGNIEQKEPFIYGQMGFQNFFEEFRDNKLNYPNFFEQLKSYGLIGSISFSINQTSEKEGFININIEPDEFAPELYSYKNKYSTNVKGVTSNSINKYGKYLWNLDISLVYYKNYKNKIITINVPQGEYHEDEYSAILNPEMGLIKGPYSYKSLIDDDFFNYFFEKEICGHSVENKKIFYYCSPKYKKELKDKFPNLFFYHQEFNYTFELTFEDLFYEKNKKIYFLIYFDNKLFGEDMFSEISEWILGRPFLNKFQFVFDVENNLISFYESLNGYTDFHFKHKSNNKKLDINENKENKENKNNIYNNKLLNNKNINLICLIMSIFFVVFLTISCYVRKNHKNIKKEKMLDKVEKGKQYIELKESLDDIN